MSAHKTTFTEMANKIDPQLAKCLNAEYWNAFGFQSGGLENESAIIVARISCRDEPIQEDAVANLIRQRTGSKTAEGVDFLGRKFVAINYIEWELIPALFQTLIDDGRFTVAAHCKLDVMFEKGDAFSRALMERKWIQQFRDFERDFGTDRALDVYVRRHQSAFKKHYNWQTAEGKQFCSELRVKLRCKKPVSATKSHFEWPQFDETCRKYGVLHRGGWSAYEPSAETLDKHLLLPKPIVSENSKSPENSSSCSSLKRKSENDDNDEQGKKSHRAKEVDDELCQVCLDRKPSTTVYPCEHRVVCTECSRALARTNDRKTCMQCRRDIVAIREDGAESIAI